ncbi:MAG: sulfatase [Kofleriaceae bacterium]
MRGAIALVRLIVSGLIISCGNNRSTREEPAPAVVDASAQNVADAASVAAAAPAAPAAPPSAPGRSEHVAFSLVDNRHLAHRFVDGDLVLDGGDIGFARYTRFGMPAPRWQLGATVDGQRAAIPDRAAMLEVPLTVEQAATSVQLTARVHAAPKQTLRLKVNGRKASKDPSVELVAGWQTVSIAIDKGRFVVGENQLALETTGAKGKIAIAWIRIGKQRPASNDDPRAATTFDPGGVISMARDAALTWFVTVPDGAHLVADVMPPCKIDVRARPSADSFVGGVLGAPGGRVDLAGMAGKVVALQLIAHDCPRATVTAPRITLHGPDPSLRPASQPPRYIILWVMDALRADKVPVFTPGARAQTPNFDELAKTSTVFRQYYVQGNESQTSHSSVWTGLYPAVHGVRLAGQGGVSKINAKLAVLAEHLTKAGLTTTAVTGNGFVNEYGGYTRGFKMFRNMMRETGVINGVIYGQAIVDAAIKQLDKVRSDPAYLFLGTIDTHGPWIARKPWIDIYSPGKYDGPFKRYGTAKELGFRPGSMGCSIIPPPEDIERLRAIYDSAISYQDQQLGRMVDQLKSWGIWDQTMLIVTADHGEEFFEDRRCGHGGSLRDSLIRVPLLVHDPARFPGGTIVDEGAEGVDLMPTMLAALGAPAVPAVQGEDLAPLAQGLGRGWPRPSYASQYEYAHAMRIGRWKARVTRSGVPVIGDLVADPGETKDLSATKLVERRMLTDHLGLFLALRTQWKKSSWGVVTNVTAVGAAALDEAHTP